MLFERVLAERKSLDLFADLLLFFPFSGRYFNVLLHVLVEIYVLRVLEWFLRQNRSPGIRWKRFVSHKLEGHNVGGLEYDLLLRRDLAVRHPGRQRGGQISRLVVIADVNLHDSHVLPLIKWRRIWLRICGSVAEVEKSGWDQSEVFCRAKYGALPWPLVRLPCEHFVNRYFNCQGQLLQEICLIINIQRAVR